MKYRLTLLLYILALSFTQAQENNRIEVSGKIFVAVDDLENVTIYNASSNKGTITNVKGEFKLEVALHDEIRVSALQLVPFQTKVTKAVLDNRQLHILLLERVNNLGEVVLLTYGITGDLKTDIDSAKVFKPFEFSFGSFENFELPDDYHSKVDNIAVGSQNDRIAYPLNIKGIIGTLLNGLFKTKDKKRKKRADFKNKIGDAFETPTSVLSEKFEEDYFVKNFNIPEEQVRPL
ncbi:carboxypeptidase-like regulatory domain-containing protein [Lacinutrix neustonica]|uniref:Carboxypeptidase-like regulatory domain-containing protein n=1 Tax=Lacinutrix neustonica TaxID=2980107 RepID=A0A9E8MVQ5_9FLAO|nr:carboxypeptidase-like regulatory domain-containing protein [Lacinutrix neustonica]WAC01497.1 carboxypeptidase-like regulatory domain-containing protein [Lacinutrix neustonica]